jgi:NADH dehydrogenase FAD-containing subunit
VQLVKAHCSSTGEDPLYWRLKLASSNFVSLLVLCRLMPYVTVSLLQSANSILTTFSGSLQQRALENFKATGVNVRLGVRVTNVTRDTIELTADGKQEVLDYGVCVWSTGAWLVQF